VVALREQSEKVAITFLIKMSQMVSEEQKLDDVEIPSVSLQTIEVKKGDVTPVIDIPFRAWLVLATCSYGVFMASVSTTALIIAFPVLLQDLNMTIGTLMWVLLVILLLVGAVVPTAGKLGDIFGQARIFQTGYFLFVFGSLGAGFVQAPNKGMDLIACRVIIGIGAAFLFTNSSPILTTAFAPYNKVGLAQGIYQLSSAMGVVLGPLIGGGLATTNWRWIFWFNVPSG
jgi:MFS family permease